MCIVLLTEILTFTQLVGISGSLDRHFIHLDKLLGRNNGLGTGAERRGKCNIGNRTVVG
jgi:hypothetical protein